MPQMRISRGYATISSIRLVRLIHFTIAEPVAIGALDPRVPGLRRQKRVLVDIHPHRGMLPAQPLAVRSLARMGVGIAFPESNTCQSISF